MEILGGGPICHLGTKGKERERASSKHESSFHWFSSKTGDRHVTQSTGFERPLQKYIACACYNKLTSLRPVWTLLNMFCSSTPSKICISDLQGQNQVCWAKRRNKALGHTNFISCFMNPAVLLPIKISQPKKIEVRMRFFIPKDTSYRKNTEKSISY